MINETINLSSVLFNQQSCSYDEQAIYKYMAHYPVSVFWLVAGAFFCAILFFYLPMFFKNIHSIVTDSLKIIIFIGCGMALVQMIPITFYLSQKGIDNLRSVSSYALVAGGIVACFYFWKFFKKKSGANP